MKGVCIAIGWIPEELELVFGQGKEILIFAIVFRLVLRLTQLSLCCLPPFEGVEHLDGHQL
jgi:hypothetical protein